MLLAGSIAAQPGPQPRAGLVPSGPVTCGGNQEIVLSNRLIETEGDGIVVDGDCELSISGSHIVAGGVGIRVRGDGEALVRSSYVEGGEAAILAEDDGEVMYSGCTLEGEARTTGMGGLVDGGGNRSGGGTATTGMRVQQGGDDVQISEDWRRISGTTDDEEFLVELGAVEEDDRIRVAVGGDVLFPFDSTEIRREAAEELAKLAHLIRRRAVGEILVVGHTDAKGGDAYNQKLSEARAQAVVDHLSRAEGIPAGLMTAMGVGSRQPVAPNQRADGSDDAAGRARNRRVEVHLATREGVDLRADLESGLRATGEGLAAVGEGRAAVDRALGGSGTASAAAGSGKKAGAGGSVLCSAGQVCDASCPEGGCTMTCSAGAVCDFDCPGGNCKMQCAAGGRCDFACPGGGCSFACALGSTCETSCSGGSCSG
jgi:outer membrane protein OmpA-like peptidoglycan-associated protein